jgi:hypothetical protein
MAIEIREVRTEADAKAFVNLPFELYKGNSYWVPPMKADEQKMLFAKTNPAFSFCDAKFWLAYRNGGCVGRIGGIINKKYNEKTGEAMARFTRLELRNDPQVATLLVEAAETWAKEKGMIGVHGPLGFINLDSQGLLVEGFDHLASIGSVYHLPYYHQLLELRGYEKEIDWLEFRLTVAGAAVDKAERGSQLIQKRFGIEVMHFQRIEDLMPHAETIFDILNNSFDELPFVTALPGEMMHFYKEKFLKFLNPEFVKLVKMKDEIIGFVIGIPSLSEAMQKAGGSLFPFGFLHILNARKGKDVLDQMLTGVRKEHMSTGAGVVLMAELQKQMLKKGMRYIETTGIFETNQNAIANWKNYEHIQHKRKRVYRKMFI